MFLFIILIYLPLKMHRLGARGGLSIRRVQGPPRSARRGDFQGASISGMFSLAGRRRWARGADPRHKSTRSWGGPDGDPGALGAAGRILAPPGCAARLGDRALTLRVLHVL